MRIRRQGKTAKDKASGAAARNAANKLARAEALKEGDPPPRHTMNGKRNRNPNVNNGGNT